MEVIASHHTSLLRQVNHWLQAATRLSSLDHLASGYAWQGIDHKIGTQLKESLQQSIGEVVALAKNLQKQLENSQDGNALRHIKRGLIQLRDRYLKTEETIHFYTVAINSRTTPNVSALLRACDILCAKSMQDLLRPLGKDTPPVLTYIDKGVGASILKAGLRLWDGNISHVAAVKITQHNLFRPTAIIHETGHQVAHILNWNEELSVALGNKLTNHSKIVGAAFSGWSSEIAADAFAFVHTGFAAVAALHDVVSGTPQAVFAYHQHDPHPIAYLRVLLNIEMCRQFYGAGPWNDLEESFKNDYDVNLVNFSSVGLIKLCVDALPDAVQLILKSPFHCFGNQALSQLVPPNKASPQALEKLEYLAGQSLYTSHAWIWNECIRLLALNGYKIGTGKGDLTALYKQQEDWMTKLGFSVDMN
ncbi:hypothetical protein [Chryseolinea sp. H1M3-3]|uniref:hypothetical protein n=1 Tax=Chryseolinea sp. H1M3-3 TaxID=3034144 RepID=UPI0023EADBF2|nr:hypothetical protein [Chryseolinea sp. H1M3-3]